MGVNRHRRPFVWQDEMVEVRNLFCRVAKVRRSGFTGFSLWKDEPTAETLSRNRLRRRQSQYALELNHLNYGESPYEALNHLHNIRGMCSRIQRQDHFVERKKKHYDLELQPALLRRPVTAYPWASKEGSEKSTYRPTRPGSAPVMAGTPLHYTPSKPTVLYDATHKCPRYKENHSRKSSLCTNSSSNKSILRNATTLKPMMANNWDPTATPRSSSMPSVRTLSVAAGSSPVESSPQTPRRRKDLQPVYSEVEGTSEAGTDSAAFYSEAETDPSAFTFSRPASASPAERPPSRMMSRRPPSVDNSSGGGGRLSSSSERSSSLGLVVPPIDLHNIPLKESAGVNSFKPTPPGPNPVGDMMPPQSRPPSRKGDAVGRLEEQRSKSTSFAATPKYKSPLDGGPGLWPLRQEQQRPMSTGAMWAEGGLNVTSPPFPSDQANIRPSSSPGIRFAGDHIPRQERVSRFGSTPSVNKIAGKKEQLQVSAVQRAFDQELQQVVLSDYGNNSETNYYSTRARAESRASPLSPTAQQHQSDVFSSERDSLEQSASASEQPLTSGTSGGDESHIMIKHSTDPYADFKNSMLRMIHEENLYDKQWELDELFQYYMDLNPAVHHEVLKVVISDIRREIAART